MKVYAVISTYWDEDTYPLSTVAAIHVSKKDAEERKSALETLQKYNTELDFLTEFRVDEFELL